MKTLLCGKMGADEEMPLLYHRLPVINLVLDRWEVLMYLSPCIVVPVVGDV